MERERERERERKKSRDFIKLQEIDEQQLIWKMEKFSRRNILS